MPERHDASVKDLFKVIEAKENYSKFGKIVEISRGDIKLVGFLVQNSIVIPTNTAKGTDESISLLVGANLAALDSSSKELPLPLTCHSLGLPYNGKILGLYTDGQNFGSVSGVHFHPEEHLANQEDFIDLVSKVFSLTGSELTIYE